MQQRSIVKVFLLSVVTLGIYRLYWFAKTRQEMMNVNEDVRVPHIIWLIAPIGMMALIVLLFVAMIVAADEHALSPVIQVLVTMVFFIAMTVLPFVLAMWLWKYSKAVELVTGEKMTFAMALLVLLAVPDGIDILIVQDTFNKMAAPEAQPSVATAPAGPVSSDRSL
ncbi:hypothetical protein CSA80_01545 [Candidatus Saccharibacteria bacterium]|nr:MAG: hypothetical protein CSA80_01545 [Candidatus Saccharibacteria bacterium]